MLRRLLAALCLVLGASLPALAGELYLFAAGAESVASAANCTAQVNASTDTGGNDHTWVSRDCPDGSDNFFLWHFAYPPDAPTTGTPFDPTISWTASSTNTGNAVFTFDMACATSTGNWNDLTYGTAQSQTTCAGPGNTTSQVLCSPATGIAPAGTLSNYPNLPCVLRVMRDGDNGSDTFTGTAKAFYVRLNY